MKKLLLAGFCCIGLFLSHAMAQGQSHHRGSQMGEINIQLADTTITSRMQLTAEQQQQIRLINQNFADSIKTNMTPASAEQRPSREELIQRMNRMILLREEGYQQLRQVLGTEDYITYLENALIRAVMRPGGPNGAHHGQTRGQRHRQGQHPGRGAAMGQMQMPEGFDPSRMAQSEEEDF